MAIHVSTPAEPKPPKVAPDPTKPASPTPPARPTPAQAAANYALQTPMRLTMSPRTNAILDYTVAFILFLAPWLLGYSDHAVTPVSRALGAVLLFYSLCTKYQLGIVRMIPLQVHLFLDLGTGGLLAAAPIHFAIWGLPGFVFFILGVMMIGAALFTRHGHKFTKVTH